MIQGLILTTETNKIEFCELKFLESMNYEKRKLFVYLLGCGRRNLECLNADKDYYGPKYLKEVTNGSVNQTKNATISFTIRYFD